MSELKIGVSEHYDERSYAIEIQTNIPDELKITQRQKRLEEELKMLRAAIQTDLRDAGSVASKVIETKATEVSAKPHKPAKLPKAPAPSKNKSIDEPPTDSQLDFLHKLAYKHNLSESAIAEIANVGSMSELTKSSCIGLIKKIKEM